MAVAIMTSSTLQLVLNAGLDPETGSPVTKYKSFNNVKPEATADQLFSIATAVADLQEFELYNILRKDTSDIGEE